MNIVYMICVCVEMLSATLFRKGVDKVHNPQAAVMHTYRTMYVLLYVYNIFPCRQCSPGVTYNQHPVISVNHFMQYLLGFYLYIISCIQNFISKNGRVTCM